MKAGWRPTKFSLSGDPVFCKVANVREPFWALFTFFCCSEADSIWINTFLGKDEAILVDFCFGSTFLFVRLGVPYNYAKCWVAVERARDYGSAELLKPSWLVKFAKKTDFFQ